MLQLGKSNPRGRKSSNKVITDVIDDRPYRQHVLQIALLQRDGVFR